MKRGLDPFEYIPKVNYKTVREKIENRTKVAGECIEWIGSSDTFGHGTMRIVVEGVPRVVYVHRYLYEQANGELGKGDAVDHICHNPRCVKLEHLRVATYGQNASNRKGADSDSTTGIRNVYFRKSNGKYMVQVKKNCTPIFGGYYIDVEDAKRKAEDMRRELFGEYAGRG